MWKTWVPSLGWEDPLEKEMAIHSSTIAWKIPWTLLIYLSINCPLENNLDNNSWGYHQRLISFLRGKKLKNTGIF